MIKIILPNEKVQTLKQLVEIRTWCGRQFGKPTLKKIKNQRGTTIATIYDEENTTWFNRQKQPNVFHFKNSNDALLFKLQWS